MLKILVPAVAAIGLVTAAAQTQSAALGSAPSASVSWHLTHDGEVAKLAYGLSNSDQLALMLTCAPGAPEVTIYGDARPVKVAMRHQGPAAPDPLSGGDAVENTVPLSDAGLGDLSRQGRMTVMIDDQTFQLPATQQERRDVDRFLAYCQTGQV